MNVSQNRIDRIFLAASRDSGDRPYLLFRDGSTASFAEVFEAASRLAGVFAAAGIGPGDRVASLLDNSRESIEFFVACSIAGAIGVVINTHSTPHEIAALMADCEPVGLVTQERFLDRLAGLAATGGLRLRLVAGGSAPGWEDYRQKVPAAAPLALDEGFGEDAPALMIYSSGTTGRPKGILLSQRGLVLNARALIEAIGYEKGDRALTLLPLFSSFGFAFDFLHTAIMRNSVVILDRFDEQEAVSCIERFRVTFLAGVPTMFARLFSDENIAGRDISSLRLIDVGGGPVSVRLKRLLKQSFGVNVVESYGLTEISPVASVQRSTDGAGSASCGLPLPGFEVRVVDSDGNDLPAGQPGELLFRADTFMIGYWNQPEQTARTIVDGWLHTGDVGLLDDNGEIQILDRTKDLIVSNGFNIFPKEVENVIAEFDGVQECAVVGVKDEIRGEIVHAFVVPRAGARPDADAVIAHCRERLSRYKVPREVHLIDAMPLTASGKIRRHMLRDGEYRIGGNEGK